MPKCPKYNFELMKPCGLAGCICHVDDIVNSNCLLFMASSLESRPLTSREIAEELSVPEKLVSATMSSFIYSSKINRVESCLNVGNAVRYVRGSGVCVSCGKDGGIPVEGVEGLVYCSEGCREDFPSGLVSVCDRLCSDPDSVLVAMVRCFSGSAIAEMLGISEEQLMLLYSRRFGIRVTEVTSGSVDEDKDFSSETFSMPKLPMLKPFTCGDAPVMDLAVVATNS